MPDSREKLYNAISNKYDLGTFDEFNTKMNSPESRKKLYDAVSNDFDLGSFSDFEGKIGGVPKPPTFGTELRFGATDLGTGKFAAPSPRIQNGPPIEGSLPPVDKLKVAQATAKIKPETMDVSPQASESIEADIQAVKDAELTKQMVYDDMRYARLTDKQQAQDRGYNNVQDYYKDRESYLINNYLSEEDREEARAQNAFIDAKKSGNEKLAAEEMQNLLNAKSKFRASINEQRKEVDSEEEELRKGLESGMSKNAFDGAMKVLNQKRATLDLLNKPYYDPKKSMNEILSNNITEVAAVSKPSQTAKEKLTEYTNALYTQLNMMREDLGWDADNGALDAYAKDFQLRNSGKGELLDKMYETELKLRNAVKVLELNRTPIENENALGVFGKSFATSFNPASASKENTQQVISQNLQSINEDAGISSAVDAEQKKFAEEGAKEYKPYSTKWFAQPAGSSAAIMLEFIPASMATEGVFAATKLGKMINIAEQYGKVKGLNTTTKYIDAVKKYKALNVADKIGKFVLKSQANGLKFGATSEAVAQLFPKDADEVNFTTGYFGGQIGKGAEQLLGGAATSLFKLFGNKAPEAAKAIESLGEKFKYTKDAPKNIIGEIGEEFGESLGQIYSESDSWKEIKAKLDEQFGTLDKATQFVIQTGIMALGMGGGSAVGSNLMKSSKEAYNKLSRDQRKIVDEVLDSVSDEETKIVNDVTNEVADEVKSSEPKATEEIEAIVNENTKKTTEIQAEPTVTEDTDLPNVTEPSTTGEVVESETVEPQTQESIVAETTPTEIIAEEGSITELPPRIEGGQPVVMEYNGGEWKQKVGNEYTRVSEEQQNIAQQQFNTLKQGGQDAISQQRPEEKISRIGETGQNQPESSSGIRQGEQGKETTKQGKKGALANLDPQTQEDFIAIKLNSTRVNPASLIAKMGKAHLTKQMRLSYLSNKGASINQIANDLINEGGVFENMDEQTVEQMVADFIINHPAGARQYANRNVEAKDALLKRYDEEAAYADQLAKEMEAEERELFYAATEDALQALDNLSDEEYDALEKLFDAKNITEDELLNRIQNGKETETTEGQKQVSESDNGKVSTEGETKSEQGGGVKKTVLTKRAYEGEFREGVKSELEKFGLTREVENQEQAFMSAKALVESIGEEAALDAVRNGDVQGGQAAAVFANVLIKNKEKLLSSTDEAEIEELNKRDAELIDEFGSKATTNGQFNSFFNYIYQNTDLGWNVEVKIQEYKNANGGEIPADVEAKFRELDRELKEVNKKLIEAEKRAADAEANAAVRNIQESVNRGKKRTYTQRSKEVADNIRKLKNKPFKFTDENGNEIDIQTMGVSWNDVVEAVAKAVEQGGKVIDAINTALENSDFYKALSDKDKNRLVQQLQEYFAETEKTTGGLSISTSTIRDFVERGITDINELTTAIYNEVKALYPNITERQVRDEITGYGKTANLSQDEVSRQIRKLKDVGRILSALEDVENKMRPLKSGMQRDKMDAEQRSLRKKLREAMKDLPQDLQTTEADLKTQLDAAKNRMRNQIDDLQREIDTKIQTPENVRTVKEDEELKALKEQRDRLKQEHDAIFKNEEFIEAKRLEQTKKRTTQRIDDLQRRLKTGDFSKAERKAVVADTELVKLRAEKLRLQDEYNKELYKAKLKNRTQAQKIKDSVWELWGIPRVLMATGEASFVGVQGLKQTIAHPKAAVKAFKNALSFMASEKNTEEWLNKIKSQEWYPILKGSKLALTEPNAELTAREELFYSGWTNIIWDSLGWAVTLPLKTKSKAAHKKAQEAWSKENPFKTLERAAVGYLDTLRVERFLDGMEMLEMKGKTFEKNKQDYVDVADAINTMTGRASLGKYGEPAAPILAKVFFSPRNWASGIKTATPYALYHFGKMTPTARKMAIADFSKFVGLTTSMVMLAAAYLNNDDDDETGVEMDPRSSDFMKIRLGNKRIDPWGGMQQQVVLSARLMADALMKGFPSLGVQGAIKKGDELLPLGVPNRTKTARGLLAQQAINKLNPTASLVYNYANTHYDNEGNLVNDYGQEYSLSNEFQERFHPIYWGTVADLMKDDPNALNGLLAFYAFWGGGVSVYESTKDKYKIADKESAITEEAKQIQSEITAKGKAERAEEKAFDTKQQQEEDLKNKVTEQEKELRKLVDKSRNNGSAIVITELEKVEPTKREKTYERWYNIGIVPEGLFGDYEIKEGEIVKRK